MQHRFSRANDGSQPEMRKPVGLDKIVDFAAVLGVAVEKRGDVVRAAQNVVAECWGYVLSVGHIFTIAQATSDPRNENLCKRQ